MLKAVKDATWAVVAGGLGAAAGLLRRRPGPRRADAWRAADFTFSHFGEDVVVRHLLGDVPAAARGCYVDVGAFDPVLHSNTYLLYLHGWRGLNVDASPARLARFPAVRPGDINVAAAVSDAAAAVLFLEYPTPGLSRVVPADAPDRTNALGEQPVAVTPCRTETLAGLLDRHLPGAAVDFLNVDCEGVDLAVLRGLDWTRHTPRVIAVEANTPPDAAAVEAFLAARGYRLVSRHLVTLVFLHASARAALPPGLWPAADR
jgi:FkbM family methyltransferase